jgi:hypothetical protein
MTLYPKSRAAGVPRNYVPGIRTVEKISIKFSRLINPLEKKNIKQ